MIDEDERGLGLKWRHRRNGTIVAYWVCSSSKRYAKFSPRTANLWSGITPTEEEMLAINEKCRRLQQEMVEMAMSPSRVLRPNRKSGKIYFIKSRGLVKIGYTAGKVENRLQKLQIGSGERLTLLGTVEGDQVIERQLHWRFKKQHSHGEWFFLQGALRTYVMKLFLEDEQAQNNASERV